MGRAFNKSEHRRVLKKTVKRSKGAIEFKHCNISAVLEILGLPSIDGYKPRGNFQEALFEVVRAHLDDRPDFYDLLSGQSETLHDGAAEYSAGEAIVVDEAPPQRGARSRAFLRISNALSAGSKIQPREMRGTGILEKRENCSFTSMRGTVSRLLAERICPTAFAGSHGMTAMVSVTTFFPSTGKGEKQSKNSGWR